MQDIVGDSACPVSKGSARTAGDQVGDGAECAEGQAVGTGDHSPQDRRIDLLKDQGNERQNTPDIQIADPPDAETEEQPFQQDKDIYAKKVFLL